MTLTLLKKTFYETLSNSSLAVIDLVDYHSDGVRWCGLLITRINVPREHRGKGVGSRLLDVLLKYADDNRVTLWLEILSYNDGGLTDDQLRDWYIRKGFREIGVGGLFRRKPSG